MLANPLHAGQCRCKAFASKLAPTGPDVYWLLQNTPLSGYSMIT